MSMLMKWSGIDVTVKHKAEMGFKGYTSLIATSVGALMILIIKQKNTNIVNQTNKLNK